jgi:hypothetical protein
MSPRAAHAVLASTLFLACSAACAARTQVPQGPSEASAPAPPRPSVNPWSDLTRDILVQRCGQCHRDDLPTRVPRALAVFDLLEDPWSARLTGEQMDELLKRVSAIRDLPPEDARAVESFVRCARDGAFCDAAAVP